MSSTIVPVAGPAPALNTLRSLLERSRDQIAMALPKHLTAERIIRMALTACHRTPKLLECDPLSVLGCVVQAAELGLELSGPLGQAYMVPRFNGKIKRQEATFQVGYRGFLALAHRSGQVRSFSAHTVRGKDSFRYQLGTDPYIKHIPAAKDRGDPIYYYSILKTKSGGEDFEVMSKDDVDRHRSRYAPKSLDDPYSPWENAYDEMAMKTVIRKLAKRAPVSTEFQTAGAVDGYSGTDLNVMPTIEGESVSLPEANGTTKTDALAARLGAAAPYSTTVAPDGADGSAMPAVAVDSGGDDIGQMLSDGPSVAEDLERTDFIRRMEEQIAGAKTAKEKREVGSSLTANRDYLGHDEFERLCDSLNPGKVR